MDALVQFLLGHLQLVVIAVAVIGFVMSKLRGGSAGSPMPPFGGPGQPARQPAQRQPGTRPAGVGTTAGRPSSGVPATARTAETSLASRASEAPPETSRMRLPDVRTTGEAASTTSNAPNSMRPVSHPANHPTDKSAFEADDLVRGVVWAEILGPPRAKRPYRR